MIVAPLPDDVLPVGVARGCAGCAACCGIRGELGFDYLRDQMAPSPSDLSLREDSPLLGPPLRDVWPCVGFQTSNPSPHIFFFREFQACKVQLRSGG